MSGEEEITSEGSPGVNSNDLFSEERPPLEIEIQPPGDMGDTELGAPPTQLGTPAADNRQLEVPWFDLLAGPPTLRRTTEFAQEVINYARV